MLMDEFRKKVKSKSEPILCSIIHSGIPGTYAAEAHLKYLPVPAGVVWFRFISNNTEIEILNSSVMEFLRRCGIRTEIHRYLIGCYPNTKAIVTASGTADGIAWLKATGFIQCSRGWIFLIKKTTQRKPKKK